MRKAGATATAAVNARRAAARNAEKRVFIMVKPFLITNIEGWVLLTTVFVVTSFKSVLSCTRVLDAFNSCCFRVKRSQAQSVACVDFLLLPDIRINPVSTRTALFVQVGCVCHRRYLVALAGTRQQLGTDGIIETTVATRFADLDVRNGAISTD